MVPLAVQSEPEGLPTFVGAQVISRGKLSSLGGPEPSSIYSPKSEPPLAIYATSGIPRRGFCRSTGRVAGNWENPQTFRVESLS